MASQTQKLRRSAFAIGFGLVAVAAIFNIAGMKGILGRNWATVSDGLWLLPIGTVVLGSLAGLASIPSPLSNRALRRGDYERALWWLKPLGPFGREPRGIVLALAGRHGEAEEIFRVLISK